MLQSEPASLQLRFLQTLTEVAAENNSTTIFPVPIDLFTPFLQRAREIVANAGPPASADAPAPAGVLPPPKAGVSAPAPARAELTNT
jgi:hypothetical protein